VRRAWPETLQPTNAGLLRQDTPRSHVRRRPGACLLLVRENSGFDRHSRCSSSSTVVLSACRECRSHTRRRERAVSVVFARLRMQERRAGDRGPRTPARRPLRARRRDHRRRSLGPQKRKRRRRCRGAQLAGTRRARCPRRWSGGESGTELVTLFNRPNGVHCRPGLTVAACDRSGVALASQPWPDDDAGMRAIECA
jgi:hypothetical protein